MDLSFQQAYEIIDQNPLFNVKNDFDKRQETISSILDELDNKWIQLDLSNKFRIKSYVIVVELLEISIKHRVESSEIHFAVTINSDSIFILSENYIHTSKIPRIKEYLDFLNQLDKIEATQLYKQIVTNNLPSENKKMIDFLEVKRKSYPRPILYHFSEEENGLVLFSIISSIQLSSQTPN